MKKNQQQISNSTTTSFNGLIQSLIFTSDSQYPWSDCTDGANGTPFQPCSIRNVSPCQNGNSEDRATRRRRSEALIREQYENINSYTEHSDRINRPAAVIINGDITEFGHNDIWHPERQWNTMNSLFRVLRRPYYYGLGNHDIENNFNHCQGNNCFATSMESLIQHVRARVPSNRFDSTREGVRYVGSFAYVVNFDRICSIQLNNYPTMDARSLSMHVRENLPWLRNRLAIARNEGRIIIVNVHQTGRLNQTYINLFQEFGVVAIFGGHLHTTLGRMGSAGGIPVFLSGSASQRTYLTLEHYPNELRIFAVRCNDWQGHRQLIHTIPIENNEFKIVTTLNNTSLVDMRLGSSNIVHLWDDVNQRNAQWAFLYNQQRNAYLIRNLFDRRLVLSMDDPRINHVFAYPVNGDAAQFWILEPNQGGYIFRSLRDRNLVLTVEGSNIRPETRILVSPFNNGTNQRFRLQSV
ncbi:metallophosphoesterase [Bacillus thuringiensis]|uniref:metallophosphoesterase n=1 Tax=Bacillus thuringiensis TaxID=1428 RepID=UPI002AB3840E|nr:metallophosphoesterase [Bacillus thuringiensis]MDY7965460.1 metallophosphoesterase [Bacillus thuringiensis]